ncbi:haloacid dehalogenase type II [Amycolatopsis sp.]|uniref:haloacid dehalogenase type II n=1 Tax=Amycolatopsis sp. TaxID=37632 RepID=UPI002CCBA7A4|nr:haloacid dehalogenase type II [Amycolatopsis sp.]HVV09066.1 haloacid dehalogenase type II [Amycolatopsis sp.]
MLCVFDINETLLDLTALDEMFLDLTGSATAREEWFTLVIHTALTVTATGGYRDFAEIAGAAAGAIAAGYGRPFDDAQRQRIGAGLRELPPHPDVPDALARLRGDGFTLVALGNSPLATIEAQLANSGLAGLFDRVFSAEQAGALKPAAAPYRQVLDAYDIRADEAIMIAAHDWDIAGAQAAGLRTGFVARPGQTELPGAPAATLTAPDLGALAELVRTQPR